ncbi:MAG TPA: hypothetical protein VGB99_04275, partial [Acidobacteriota bacterium]
MTASSEYAQGRRRLWKALAGLAAAAIGFGVLHLLFQDLESGGVSWFHLDKERNLPTWYSGVLFLLLGAAACAAFFWEQRRGRERPGLFRLPWLWLVLAGLGFLMSLDEITILHENLYWREIRQLSIRFGPRWQYVTQWQLLFAPAIVLAFGFLAIFLIQRLRLSRTAGRGATLGLACWLVALLPEGVRQGLKLLGSGWYTAAVVLEEELEMVGAILLVGAVALYVLVLALDLSPQRVQRLQRAGGFLTRRAVWAVGGVAALLLVTAGLVLAVAGRLAERKAPVPALMQKAAPDQARGPTVRPRPRLPAPAAQAPPADPARAAAPRRIWFEDLRGPLPAFLHASELDAVALVGVLDSGAPDRPLPAELAGDHAARILLLALSDGSAPAQVTLGSGAGVVAALHDAWSRQSRRAAAVWCRIELVSEVSPLPSASLDRPLRLEPGVQGVALARGSEAAFLPEELLVRGLADDTGVLRWADLAAASDRSGLGPGASAGAPASGAFLFTTESVFVDLASWTSLPLYRGHPRGPDPDPERLLEAARLGGRYLVGAVAADGRMIYSYHADRDRAAPSYNILRHAGTAYAMLELYEVTREPDLLAAAERALGFLLTQIR